MILYDLALEKNFAELGIPIENRAQRCYREIISKYGDDSFFDLNCDIPPLLREDFLRAHSKEFVEKIFSSEIESEIYKAYELEKYGREKMDLAAFGKKILAHTAVSAESMRVCLSRGWSYFLGGGMHHAHSAHGSGFCLVNDIVIGIRKLQFEGIIEKAWVIDLDAHKGDGTAEITSNDSTIKTLSIHMKKGWPLEKGDFHSSDIDIAIDCNEDHLYLDRLQKGLAEVGQCDFAVIVDGSDAYEKDALPSASLLKLTKEQMLRRNELVFEYLKEKKIPQCYLLGGGYGEYSWQIHYQFLDYLLAKKK